MAVFSIADLHLSEGVNKPMDVFGHRWQGYTEKLLKNWKAIIKDEDTVIIPGDISWAMNLREAERDFKLIDSLPGKKLIGKGNHDYWWETVTKMKRFLSDKGVNSIDFLYNNAFIVEDFVVCGTRGWFIEERLQTTDEDYEKLSVRENGRLRASLDCAKKLLDTPEGFGKRLLVYLHFPPVFGDFHADGLISLMKEYGVSHCYYGHIHGRYDVPRTINNYGIPLTIIAADHLDFVPMITVG